MFNNKALATSYSTFFENNFSYGLTLKIWYDLKVFGANGQEDRWSEFLKYCKYFETDDYELRPLKAFNLKETLPTAMLFFDKLPEDQTDLKCKEEFCYPDNLEKSKEFKFFDEWQEQYDKWYKKQEAKFVQKSETDEESDGRKYIEEPIDKFKRQKKLGEYNK